MKKFIIKKFVIGLMFSILVNINFKSYSMEGNKTKITSGFNIKKEKEEKEEKEEEEEEEERMCHCGNFYEGLRNKFAIYVKRRREELGLEKKKRILRKYKLEINKDKKENETREEEINRIIGSLKKLDFQEYVIEG